VIHPIQRRQHVAAVCVVDGDPARLVVRLHHGIVPCPATLSHATYTTKLAARNSRGLIAATTARTSA
jgi:hypothetical protein